ncbi:hypothetical protein LP420_01350 [Massilia sp. B-10]|nr:hypothetical protein LP420_01350 [Massilia sp. B-10]
MRIDTSFRLRCERRIFPATPTSVRWHHALLHCHQGGTQRLRLAAQLLQACPFGRIRIGGVGDDGLRDLALDTGNIVLLRTHGLQQYLLAGVGRIEEEEERGKDDQRRRHAKQHAPLSASSAHRRAHSVFSSRQ